MSTYSPQTVTPLPQVHPQILTGLQWLQLALLGLVIVFAPHTQRWVLWEVDLSFVFIGFRAVLFFLFGIPLLAAVVVQALQLLLSPDKRQQFSDTITEILSIGYGGLWLALLVIWLTLGIFWAEEPILARYGAIHTGLLLALALILAETVRRGYDQVVLWAFVFGAGLQSAIAIGQVIQGDAIGLDWLGEFRWEPDNLYGFAETTFRGYGLTPHPNMLAGYLLIGLFAVATLLFRPTQPERWRSISLLTLGGLILAGLLVTFSRTALVAGLLTAFIAVLLTPQIRQRLSLKKSLPFVIPLVLIILAVAVLFGGRVLDRFQSLRDTDSVFNRILFEFPNTTEVIEDNPVLGAGDNNLMVAVGRNNPNAEKLLLPAHNTFWVMIAEIGIPGIVLFGLACGAVLLRFHPRHGILAFIWAGALLAILLVMLFDYYPWYDYRSRLVLFWIFGMWWGYHAQAQDNAQFSTPESE